MPALDTLLAVQERDIAIDRLRHRRATLPERAALAEADVRLRDVAPHLAEVRARHDDLAREERRLDDEARALEQRAIETEKRLYSGEISSPRELQAMQADIEQLRRHRSSVEDDELGLMEQRETLDAELGAFEAQLADIESGVADQRAALAAQEQVIDAEMAQEMTARDELVRDIPPELLATYERCRAQARGVGAARLVGRTCQGCHLDIPATEAERIKRAPEGTVAHCDNCGCILVP